MNHMSDIMFVLCYNFEPKVLDTSSLGGIIYSNRVQWCYTECQHFAEFHSNQIPQQLITLISTFN